MTTITERALKLVDQRPDDIALVFIHQRNERYFSYRAFFAQASDVAGSLRKVGIAKNDLVVLVMEHSPQVMFAFWGALLIGAIPSIFPFLTDKLDPERYFSSVRALIERSQVKAIITTESLHPGLSAALNGLPVPLLTLENSTHPDLTVQSHSDSAEDIAFLQHSSGSTGLQKGVMLSHRAVLNQIDAYSRVIALTEEDVVVSWLPLYHDMGLIAGFIMPLVQGVKLVLMSPFEWVRQPQMLLYAIHQHKGTLCWLPNFAYNFLASRIRDDALQEINLNSLRAVINCSEPVYAESHQQFLHRFQPYGFRPEALATCYAMAENTFAVTQSRLGEPPRIDRVATLPLLTEGRAMGSETEGLSFVSCGRAIPGCEIRVVNERGEELPERYVGEIILQSNSMLDGYYGQPELSAQAIKDGWYYTGDMGYLADEELYITGRKKDLIIVGGKNIYPQDIENLLNDIVGIHAGRIAAFGVPNTTLGTEDIAVVAEVEAEDSEERADIMRAIRARVTQTLDVAVRYIHLVDAKWLIKTSSGKVARTANRDKFMIEVLGRKNS